MSNFGCDLDHMHEKSVVDGMVIKIRVKTLKKIDDYIFTTLLPAKQSQRTQQKINAAKMA